MPRGLLFVKWFEYAKYWNWPGQYKREVLELFKAIYELQMISWFDKQHIDTGVLKRYGWEYYGMKIKYSYAKNDNKTFITHNIHVI